VFAFPSSAPADSERRRESADEQQTLRSAAARVQIVRVRSVMGHDLKNGHPGMK
jgi:hypothetical protein